MNSASFGSLFLCVIAAVRCQSSAADYTRRRGFLLSPLRISWGIVRLRWCKSSSRVNRRCNKDNRNGNYRSRWWKSRHRLQFEKRSNSYADGFVEKPPNPLANISNIYKTNIVTSIKTLMIFFFINSSASNLFS